MPSANELELLVNAQVGGLIDGMEKASTAVDDAATSMQGSLAQINASASVTSDAVDELGATLTSMSQESSARFEEMSAAIESSFASATAEINDMAQSALAPIELMAAATEGVAESVDDLNAMVVQLNAAYREGTISAAQLAEAQLALEAQMQAITDAAAEQSVAYKALYDQQNAAALAMTSLSMGEDEFSAALDVNSGSLDVNTASLEANTAAKVENDAAGGGGKGGRFHPMGLFGAASEIVHGLTTPVGMAVGAFAALTAAIAYSEQKAYDFNAAITMTGDYAASSGADIESMAHALSNSSVTVGTAADALTILATSGRITSSQLESAGQAASDMAILTDESMKKATQAIEQLGANPLKASMALTNQFHYLTAAEYEQISRLQREGDVSGAATVAIDSLREAEQRRLAQVNSDEPVVLKWLKEELHAWENIGHAIFHAQKSSDLVQRNRVTEQLNALYKQDPGGFTRSASGVVSFSNANHFYTDNIMGRWSQEHAQKLVAEYNSLTQHIQAHHNKQLREQLTLKGENASSALDPYIRGFNKVADRAEAAKKVVSELHAMVAAGLPLPSGVEQTGQKFSGPGFNYLVDRVAGISKTAKPYIPAADTHWDVGTLSSLDRSMMRTDPGATTGPAEVATYQTNLRAHANHQVAMQQMLRTHVQAMASMGTLSKTSEIAQEQAIANEIYKIKLKELQREQQLENTKPQTAARINAEITRLQDQHTSEMMTLSDKASQAQIRSAQAVVQPIIQTFGQVTTGFVEGTLTRQQAEMRLGDALVAETINTGIQMLMHHIAIEEAKTLATASGVMERVALTIMGEAQAAAIHALHAIEWIVTESAKAAASAFTALAGIPVVGPALAVAASIAAGAEVLSFVGRVASAEGGWGRVPADGTMTELHKDEMVLPAELAEGVRNMSSGGGVTNHFHIQAWDGRSMGDFIRRNPAMLSQWASHASRTGNAV